MKAVFAIGRILFGGFFLYNGINHFRHKDFMAQYAAAKHVPEPELAILSTGGLLAVAGLSLILGVKPKLGAAGLLAFLAGVTPTMHDFWNVEDPQQKATENVQFMKNVALAGAALSLMAVEEPWPASLPLGDHDRRLAAVTVHHG